VFVAALDAKVSTNVVL